jgi:predicted methyltransferase
MKFLNLTIITFFSLTLFACASNDKGTPKKLGLNDVVKLDHRAAEDKARDKFRHPVQTLQFFDIQPNHTVVEINPSGGWYTEILGPYLKDEGTLYLAIFDKNSKKSYAKKLNKKIKEVVSDSSLYGDIKFTVIDDSVKMGPVAPKNSVDRVVTFRNVHGWIRNGKSKEAFKAFFEALKPGGILGLVQHRLPEKMKQDSEAKTGYVHESYVIKLADDAGFKLVEKSEINSNPKDTANHKMGVWTLPPALRADDSMKEKYKKIGESDRMTLKFIKPM